MQRDVESFADFLQYYTNSFVKSRVDANAMYYVAGPSDAYKRAVLVSTYKDGVIVKNNISMTEIAVNEVFEWGLPSIGMTVYDDKELVYLYYRTNRKGNRGFASNRILMQSFNGYILQQNGLPVKKRESLNEAEHVWQALNQRHLTLDTAWKDLTSKLPKKLAYAVTSRFGVHLTEQEYPVLCYKMHTIGEVLGPSKVRLQEKHREYTDVVRRVLNPKMEIEIK